VKYEIRRLRACRICGADGPRRFLHFEGIPFTEDFLTAERLGTEFLADLDIYFCAGCRTVQTLHDVVVTEYYKEYRYSASLSPFVRSFMRKLAAAARDRFGLGPGDRVIEVGSADGHQLSCFQDLGFRVLGFEPSDDLARASRDRGIPVVHGLFGAGSADQIPAGMRPAQVVLLTYTFDHLPDPLGFLASVARVLDEERGVLLIEVHDLARILERRETCLFEHEHSVYLSAASLERLLQRAGFTLLAADVVPERDRRGNSLLVAAARNGSRHRGAEPPFDRAALASLEEWPAYEAFGEAVAKSQQGLRDWVRRRRRAGRRIAGYGAGGRGVTTLAMADLHASDIEYVCDQNPGFQGRFTPRSHVPVVAPERLLSDPADETIVFSFGYLEEIRQQLRAYEERGGRFVSLLDLL
jgi:SAM-dependent methyltransferase